MLNDEPVCYLSKLNMKIYGKMETKFSSSSPNSLNTCNEEKPSSTVSFDSMQHHVATLAFNDAESTL